MQEKRLAWFQEIGNKRYDDGFFVQLTTSDNPESLLSEFCKKIVQPNYRGGVSDAIKDLMQKAIFEQRTSHDDASVLAK